MHWVWMAEGKCQGQLRQLKKRGACTGWALSMGETHLTQLTCWDSNKLRGLEHVGEIDMWKIKYGGETLLL